MKCILLVVVAVLSVSAAAPAEEVDAAWAKFKLDHGRQYRSLLEEAERKTIFVNNYNRIAEHNALYEQDLVTYTQKINHYSDRTSEEMKQLKGYKRPVQGWDDFDVENFHPGSASVPNSIDWRSKGAVTKVKDQGYCGDCWSFSATGALEGQYYLKTGKLRSLSEQNLVDCSTAQGNGGCNGGLMNYAFQYVHENDGIDSEESYPYEAADHKSCRYKAAYNVTSLKGVSIIQAGNEAHMKAAVGTVGPIAIAMDASKASFDSYSGGIYYEPGCSSTNLDHGVLIVGYGSESGHDYWLVKNSWTAKWGEAGYMKIARNKKNHCGIATEGSYPILY